MSTRPEPKAAIDANRLRSVQKRAQVSLVLDELERKGVSPEFASVARLAGCSDDFVRKHFDDRVRALQRGPLVTVRPSSPTPEDASYKQRAENAEARVSQLEAEVHAQRAQIGRYIGQLRDLEASVEGAGDLRRLQDEKAVAVAEYNASHKRIADLELQLNMSRQHVASLNQRTADLEVQLLEARRLIPEAPGAIGQRP